MGDEKCNGRHVVVGIPAYDSKILITAAVSLLGLGVVSRNYGFRVSAISIPGNAIIEQARNDLVEKFLHIHDGTDFMMLDADISFVPEDVAKLLMLTAKYDIACGAYPMKREGEPYRITFEENEDGNIVMMDDRYPSVERIGTGFMMVRRHVFSAMMPFTPNYYNKKENRRKPLFFEAGVFDDEYVGEDYRFCDLVKKAGMNIVLDPSINLGHIGYKEYIGDLPGKLASLTQGVEGGN